MSSVPPPPRLLTFDFFGTVLDWRRGLAESLARRGYTLGDSFDRVIDRQGVLEQTAFDSYTAIVARSLVDILGVEAEAAAAIGREAGTWPLYDDSVAAFERLLPLVPCAALTNSDRAHGEDIQRALGRKLTHWVCAEEALVYKPNSAFWDIARVRTGVAFGPEWWHVSAYADYDLDVAAKLGLTTVFIQRPHARPGPATVQVNSLIALAELVESYARTVQ